MNLIRITPPAALPISLAEVKAVARLPVEDSDDQDDAVLMGYIRAAVDRVEGPDGVIQRPLITQTWELRLDRFPFEPVLRSPGMVPAYWWPCNPCAGGVLELELPLPPLQSVASITYTASGSDVVLSTDAYRVGGIGDRNKARIRPVSSWPSADDVPDAVRIRFVCGYGDSWNDVPEQIRLAIASMVQGYYDGCDTELPERLLKTYKVDLGFA